ncbi:SIS domain-containing protein [Pseudoalteromonas sp. SWN29]|uniref:SIS domain-containing protein n=1 Tax=Pseudoalteromonas sp. SWN29 TaxID=2792064 RepID=UPI0018CE93F8|nr:SIS domain-containing protein [Pseudoalteromonas sp. SWN29]MBH0028551.1 SIS domain-containing protein [Pseudoalteromonas sp. SWN29]
MKNKQTFVQGYITKVIDALESINTAEVSKIISSLDECHYRGGTVYIIGNGGSAATASHMANDFGGGLKLRDIRTFKIASLADNSALCTAIANDVGFENIFYAQIVDEITNHDLLIAISCSGDSPNIVKAAEYAKQQGVNIIGLTGFSGGKLKELSTFNYHIETEAGEYGVVEDLHMIFDHMIFSYFLSLEPEKQNYSKRFKA